MSKKFKKEEILNSNIEDAKIETVEKVELVKESKPEQKPAARPVRKQVTRDMEVAIMNNTHGGFIYIDPKTFSRHEMAGYGDIDYITVGELLNMKNSQRAIIDNFWVVIVEVLSDEVEMADILRYLGLEALYKNVLTSDEMDKLILKSSPANFKKTFDTIHAGMANRIVERALELFKAGKFNDWAKFDVIKAYTQNDMIFDISAEK